MSLIIAINAVWGGLVQLKVWGDYNIFRILAYFFEMS
jgi:hypothetical protein